MKFANATKLVQEVRGSVGEGPAVSLSAQANAKWGESPLGFKPRVVSRPCMPLLFRHSEDKYHAAEPRRQFFE
jgi:hypothetical protein